MTDETKNVTANVNTTPVTVTGTVTPRPPATEAARDQPPPKKPVAKKPPARKPAPKAPPKPTIAALHDLLDHYRLVFVDPFGQRWTFGNADAKEELVFSGFPESINGRVDEWQEPERALVIGGKEYPYTRR